MTGTPKLLRFSAVLTLIGLALMCWAVLSPTVLPVMVAMSVGQICGTIAFLVYLFVIAREYRRAVRGKRPS
jgi:hypothetical protein